MQSPEAEVSEIPEQHYRFDRFPEYRKLQAQLDQIQQLGLRNPYFNVQEGVCNDTTTIGGRELINYSTYNYVGMSGIRRFPKRPKRRSNAMAPRFLPAVLLREKNPYTNNSKEL